MSDIKKHLSKKKNPLRSNYNRIQYPETHNINAGVLEVLKQQPKTVNAEIVKTDNVSQKLYEATNPNLPNEINFESKELAVMVNSLSEGQKTLERIKKYNSNLLYRGFWDVVTFFKKDYELPSVYDSFIEQDLVVGELNQTLAIQIQVYGRRHVQVSNELSTLVQKAITEHHDFLKLDNNLPEKIEQCNQMKEKLNDMNKDTPEYLQALLEYDEVQSALTIDATNYSQKEYGKNHYSKQVEQLRLNKNIYLNMLAKAMKIAHKTDLYQKTLRQNIPLLKDIHDISQAVGIIGDGMDLLTAYSNEIHEIYFDSVNQINNANRNHNGLLEMDRTIRNLDSLASETRRDLLE